MTSTFKARLAELGNDTLLASAESIFKSTAESSSLTLTNPRGIKEELAFLKEFCYKLKFQYLEQETRDKFLRHLLMEDTHNVSVDELDQIVKANVELKHALKELKTEMDTVVEQSESLAEEVIDLQRAYSARRLEVDEALAGVDSLQKELDGLLQDPENENHVTLFNMKRLIDTEDIGLNEALEIAEAAVSLESQVVAELDRSVDRAKGEHSAKEKVVASLQDSLSRLQVQLDKEALKPKQDIDPQQAYAQWLREVNSMMEKFIPVRMEIETENKTSVLAIGTTKISLDESLSIVACSNRNRSSQAITEIDCADHTTKFWKLSRFLSEIIFAS